MMKSESADCRIKPALPLCSNVSRPHVLHKSARLGAAINQAWQCTPNKLGGAVTCGSGGVGVAYVLWHLLQDLCPFMHKAISLQWSHA